ncbi:MAG: hypothetical protein ACAH88_04075, partial [Roseimicrobium sp.]
MHDQKTWVLKISQSYIRRVCSVQSGVAASREALATRTPRRKAQAMSSAHDRLMRCRPDGYTTIENAKRHALECLDARW